MNIANVALQIDKVANFVVPITSMPLGHILVLGARGLLLKHPLCKPRLEVGNPAIEIQIIFRQRPDHMHMIGQDDRGDRIEWVEALNVARAFGQQLGMPGEERTALIRQI